VYLYVMKIYQQITGAEECTIQFSTLVENSFSGFCIAAGTGNANGDGLLNTGLIFSGSEGYIFDQSGRFVGGYEADQVFDILVHSKSNNTFSFFIDGTLIANNYHCPTGFDYIEYDKHGSANLNITHNY
jgi:hypothetical protein